VPTRCQFFWSFLIYKSGVAAAPASHERIPKGWRIRQGIVGHEPMGRKFRASSIQVRGLLGRRTKTVGMSIQQLTTRVVPGVGSPLGQTLLESEQVRIWTRELSSIVQIGHLGESRCCLRCISTPEGVSPLIHFVMNFTQRKQKG